MTGKILSPFHPESQALNIARKANAGAPVADPKVTAECWVGRARMAHARRNAGVDLDSIDEEAIRRHPAFEPVKPR